MKNLWTRRQFTLSSLAATTMFPIFTGCSPKKKSKFRVGVLLPKTGVEAQIGLSCERGAKIAPLILSDIGMDIELIYADTESRVDIGKTKAEKLINDGAHAIVGAYDSGITAAVAQVCEQNKIPLVINIAASNQITEQGYKYVFRNFPKAKELTANGINLIQQLFDYKKVKLETAALMHINDTYGEGMRKAIDEMQNVLPLKIVEKISYDPNAKDLSTEISRIKASKAEILLCVTRLNDAILMIKECVKQKYQPQGIISPGSPGMYENQFYKILGKYSDHCITNTAWYDPHSSLTKRAKELFQKAYPKDLFEMNVAFTLEAILIVADAYRRAQSTNSEDLREAISKINLKERLVCGGPIQFDDKGQGTGIESASMQNFDGKPLLIFPEKFQEVNPVFPMPRWS